MRRDSFDGTVWVGVILAIALLLIGIYLLVRATGTIVTTYAAHPGHKLMTALGLLTLVGLGLTAAANGNPGWLAFTAASFGLLWCVARVIQLREDQMLQRGWSLDEVLQPGTWWSAA